jgi:hypothetical protein
VQADPHVPPQNDAGMPVPRSPLRDLAEPIDIDADGPRPPRPPNNTDDEPPRRRKVPTRAPEAPAAQAPPSSGATLVASPYFSSAPVKTERALPLPPPPPAHEAPPPPLFIDEDEDEAFWADLPADDVGPPLPPSRPGQSSSASGSSRPAAPPARPKPFVPSSQAQSLAANETLTSDYGDDSLNMIDANFLAEVSFISFLCSWHVLLAQGLTARAQIDMAEKEALSQPSAGRGESAHRLRGGAPSSSLSDPDATVRASQASQRASGKAKAKAENEHVSDRERAVKPLAAVEEYSIEMVDWITPSSSARSAGSADTQAQGQKTARPVAQTREDSIVVLDGPPPSASARRRTPHAHPGVNASASASAGPSTRRLPLVHEPTIEFVDDVRRHGSVGDAGGDTDVEEELQEVGQRDGGGGRGRGVIIDIIDDEEVEDDKENVPAPRRRVRRRVAEDAVPTSEADFIDLSED